MVLDKLGRGVSKYPKITISITIIVTALAIFSIQINGLDQEFSEEAFLPDMDIVIASNEISEDFTSTYSVTVLVKSKQNDVLTSDSLVEILETEKAIIEDNYIESKLEYPSIPSSNINSIADVIAQSALSAQGNLQPNMDEKIFVIENMNDQEIKGMISTLITDENTPVSVKALFTLLLTKDFEPIQLKAKGTLISVSLNTSLLSGSGNHGMSSDSIMLETEKRIDKVVNDINQDYIEISVLGEQLINDEILTATTDSMAIILPIAFTFIIVILAIIYRNIFDILFSLLALGFAIIWIYGFGSAMGYSFNPITTAVPVLIVGLGIDYGIHVTMRYREELKNGKQINESIIRTIQFVGMALLLATVTTVVSFLSNISSPISLLGQFGILSAVGILGSFFTMTTFVPACKQLRDQRRQRKGKIILKGINNNKSNNKERLKTAGVKAINKFIGFGATVAKKRPKVLVLSVFLITIAAGGLAAQLDTTFNYEDFLPKDLEITKDYNFLMDEFELMGGGQEVDILVKGDTTDPTIISGIHDTIENMKDDESVIQNEGKPEVTSILSYMNDWATDYSSYDANDNFDANFKSMYDNVFNSDGTLKTGVDNNDIEDLYTWLYSNPSSYKGVKNVLYQSDEGFYKSTVLRISVNVDETDNEKIEALHNDLKDDKKPLDSTANKAIITGGPILTKIIMDTLNESQIRSLFITIILSLIVLTIVFYYKWKSIILATITITPVIFCVIWTLGTMYIIGWSLNIMTIMITSLTIGLGITYGIHITHRFLEDLDNHYIKKNTLTYKRVKCPNCGRIVRTSGKPGETLFIYCPECGTKGKIKFEKYEENDFIYDASKTTLTHTGTALFGAATTTIAGFGLLVFALLPPLQQFGGITALTILYSFLASVFILPTFLTIWAKRTVEKHYKKKPIKNK